jgi:hypothetical protein
MYRLQISHNPPNDITTLYQTFGVKKFRKFFTFIKKKEGNNECKKLFPKWGHIQSPINKIAAKVELQIA